VTASGGLHPYQASTELSHWSPEKRKKEMLRKQLEQKTREVQNLRNKLLSKRLEQASTATKDIEPTQTVATKPSTGNVVMSVLTGGSSSSFKPPPPLRQTQGGQKAREVDSSQRGALTTGPEPAADASAAVSARGGAVVEVEVRDEQPVQRKAPELCWDLRRRVGSGHDSKVHPISHGIFHTERLDEKKKLLQELMQKRRSLSVGVAQAGSQAPAVIDLS
jgi:hypothetical protein